ncbi:MAG: hypothetical protein JSS02_01880, partial [Planctomycetes bacterium]|nr:hypothetical protein [Planctomycetota bacterium]
MRNEETDCPNYGRRNWPSCSDKFVRYNAGSRNGRLLYFSITGKREKLDPFQYFDSVSLVPRIEDVDDVKTMAHRYLSSFFKDRNSSLIDEFGSQLFEDVGWFRQSGETAGLVEDFDRTLEVPIVYISIITGDFIRHIQKTLLCDFPLWRLNFVPNSLAGEAGIMVYPDVVVVGTGQCPPCDLLEALDNWRLETASIRDRTQGCRVRQLRFVLRMVRHQLPMPADFRFSLLANFDNDNGDFDYETVWALFYRTYNSFVVVDDRIAS